MLDVNEVLFMYSLLLVIINRGKCSTCHNLKFTLLQHLFKYIFWRFITPEVYLLYTTTG